MFNPEKAVIENINSYLDQTDHLYVIDNSESVSDFVKVYYEKNKKVEYIFNNNNIGIAAALNIAAQKSLALGFQYLLTMDQDSKAPLNLVSSCVSIFEGSNNVGLVTPIHGNKYGTHIKPVVSKTEKVTMAMTSGNLISLDVYKRVGGFDEDFFLDYMDIEYCFKLHLHHYDLIRINDLVLDHNEADLTEISIFKKKVHPHNHKPFRWYYKTRNMFLLRKKYKNIFPELFSIEFNSYLRMIARLILFEKYKIRKIKMILLGWWDYLNNKKGKKF
ncbi:MAG: glycosyltransferase [bacterium]|nr:glycosyltransferase [bacterium]